MSPSSRQVALAVAQIAEYALAFALPPSKWGRLHLTALLDCGGPAAAAEVAAVPPTGSNKKQPGLGEQGTTGIKALGVRELTYKLCFVACHTQARARQRCPASSPHDPDHTGVLAPVACQGPAAASADPPAWQAASSRPAAGRCAGGGGVGRPDQHQS